mgnify:CR=1 FL=1
MISSIPAARRPADSRYFPPPVPRCPALWISAAAIDEGYDVFLVPSREFPVAQERAGDAIEVIAVDTLRDALDALASLGGSGLGNPADEG